MHNKHLPNKQNYHKTNKKGNKTTKLRSIYLMKIKTSMQKRIIIAKKKRESQISFVFLVFR